MMNRLSKIFQPINKIPKNAQLINNDITSKSQKVTIFYQFFAVAI